MDGNKKRSLQITACKVRKGIIEGVYNAKSGHPGGSLSIADLLTYLYFEKMNVNQNDPDNADRDRFVLSKGHCAPALYSALALKGYFPEKSLKLKAYRCSSSGTSLYSYKRRRHVKRFVRTRYFRRMRYGSCRKAR